MTNARRDLCDYVLKKEAATKKGKARKGGRACGTIELKGGNVKFHMKKTSTKKGQAYSDGDKLLRRDLERTE